MPPGAAFLYRPGNQNLQQVQTSAGNEDLAPSMRRVWASAIRANVKWESVAHFEVATSIHLSQRIDRF